ncbi:MAG: SDR family NAD(P)-dependent oxidoreductase, partial [Blastocatellia bacterium]
SNGQIPFKNEGVYLIIGGTGGVGMLLTRYLTENFAASVSLTGRTMIPDRTEWEEWLACHGSADPVSGKIRKLMDMEEAGVKPRVFHADSSNEDEMRNVISEVQKAHGRIDGIIYAAGVTSGRSVFNPIRSIGREEAEEQFCPKAHGLYVLEKVLKGAHSDFCMLISSNAAVLGGIGFVAYAAANAFMDAFAISRGRDRSTRWVSANWDHWPEETKQYLGFQTSMDQYAMTSEESLRAFSVVASAADEGHIVVSTGDLPSRYDLWVANLLSSRSSPPGNRYSSQGPAYGGRKITSYSAPTNETERAIDLLWQEGLGIDQISIDDNFFDLGGHSLLAMR